MNPTPKPQVLERIRGEFLEMPGLRLTKAQAARLWALGQDECGPLLEGLVAQGFLAVTRDGAFVRRQSDPQAGGLRRVS